MSDRHPNMAHGHATRAGGRSLTYNSWRSMNDRCTIPTHKWWHCYGGRGITVCERWRRGTKGAFANFLADLQAAGIGERTSKQMTLDRLKVDVGYEPGNVKWSTKAEQRANQRGSDVS